MGLEVGLVDLRIYLLGLGSALVGLEEGLGAGVIAYYE